MKKPKRKKLIAYIDADMWDAAAEQAVLEDRSTASLIRKALRRYLVEREKWPE